MTSSLMAEVTEILTKVPIVKNPARKKFISQFTLGLIQSRNVQFCQVAHYLNNKAKVACNEVRIQDFFREPGCQAVDLDYTCVAMLLLSLLPKGKKLWLCIDRTEWDFGQHQVNILMGVVGYQDITVLLYHSTGQYWTTTAVTHPVNSVTTCWGFVLI